jgi:hypothetical protein
LARQKEGKVEDHAAHSTPGSYRRGRCSSLAGESLYSHAVIYQVNPKRCSGHRFGSLAAERFWTLPSPFPHPHWVVKMPKRNQARTQELPTQDRDKRNPADICHKEID